MKKINLGDKEREEIYEPIEKLLETVFSSWVSLNHSFLTVKLSFLFHMLCVIYSNCIGRRNDTRDKWD